MARKQTSPNVIVVIACAAAVLFVIGVGIYPQHLAITKEDGRIESLKTEIDKQKLLHPLYRNLVEKAHFTPPPELVFPKMSKLARADVGRLSGIFTEAAESSHLLFETVMPQVNSLNDRSGYLMADLTVKGNYLDFRAFLLKLGEMPFLEHIERVRIERTGTLDLIEVRLWLVLE